MLVRRTESRKQEWVGLIQETCQQIKPALEAHRPFLHEFGALSAAQSSQPAPKTVDALWYLWRSYAAIVAAPVSIAQSLC